jgi:hypothetical protein
MKDIRPIFDGEGILEKTSREGVFKRYIFGVTLTSSTGNPDDFITVDMGDYGYEYLVDSEDVTIESDGSVSFEAFDAKYVIRKVSEADDLRHLNPELKDSEELTAESQGTEIKQSVEALVDASIDQVVTIVYDVENLGTFFRIDGKWRLGTPEIAAEFDGTDITELDYDKSVELVARFDDNELITSKDLAYYERSKKLDQSANLDQATESDQELIGIVDRLDAKALNHEALENIRESSGNPGEVAANPPLEVDEETKKIRYGDVPAPLQQLMKDMIGRVEAKIGDEDADVATADLKKFMTGTYYFNRSEISSEMAKLLRLLT